MAKLIINLLDELGVNELELYCGGERVDITVNQEDYKIDPENLAEDLIRLPGEFAYWGKIFAAATSVSEESKFYLEEVLAGTELEIREEFKGERVTEGRIKAEVTIRGPVKEAKRQYTQRRWVASQIKAKLSALEKKHQSALDISASRRQEAKLTQY